nr:UV damage endonuclease UvsE [Oscillochloris trichoides]
MPTPPHIRLGFAVRIVGRPGLGAGGPAHLSLALVRLGDVLGYLEHIGVQFYRIRPDLITPQTLDQLEECSLQLDLLAARLAHTGIRLTSHMDHGVALGCTDMAQATASLAAIEATAALLERLDAHRPAGSIEGTLVVHVGASPTDPAGLDRFATRFMMLSARARARLAVEHESAGFSLGQLLILHQHCGVPVVFDMLHWELFNPEAIPLSLALGLALATWPVAIRPEVHLSSPRSEAHLVPAQAHQPGRVLPPRPGQHADFIEAAALQRLLVAARVLPAFDLMLEAKAGDLALLRLRHDMAARWL